MWICPFVITNIQSVAAVTLHPNLVLTYFTTTVQQMGMSVFPGYSSPSTSDCLALICCSGDYSGKIASNYMFLMINVQSDNAFCEKHLGICLSPDSSDVSGLAAVSASHRWLQVSCRVSTALQLTDVTGIHIRSLWIYLEDKQIFWIESVMLCYVYWAGY